MATSKFDELVNLISRQVVRRLEGRDKMEFGSDKKTSGRQEGELSYDPLNTGDELDISSELDPETRRNLTEPSAEEEYQSEDDIEAVANLNHFNATDSEDEEEDEEEDENHWKRERAKKFRDGFKLMRGDDE